MNCFRRADFEFGYCGGVSLYTSISFEFSVVGVSYAVCLIFNLGGDGLFWVHK